MPLPHPKVVRVTTTSGNIRKIDLLTRPVATADSTWYDRLIKYVMSCACYPFLLGSISHLERLSVSRQVAPREQLKTKKPTKLTNEPMVVRKFLETKRITPGTSQFSSNQGWRLQTGYHQPGRSTCFMFGEFHKQMLHSATVQPSFGPCGNYCNSAVSLRREQKRVHQAVRDNYFPGTSQVNAEWIKWTSHPDISAQTTSHA